MPDAAHMTALLNHYGYLAVLAGTFLEGETVLLVAGALAREGYMSLFWVGLSAFMGGLGSDQLMFALGRRYGPAFLAKRPPPAPRGGTVGPVFAEARRRLYPGGSVLPMDCAAWLPCWRASRVFRPVVFWPSTPWAR